MTDQTPTSAGAEEAPASFPNPYPLRFPITTPGGGTKIESVTVRRPKVREVRAFEEVRKEKGELEASLDMLARLCGLTPEQVDELDTLDFQALSEIMAGFTEGASPPTTGAR